MMIPVVPGHRRCQHCMDALMLSVDGQLRTAQGERLGTTTCEGMPRVAHKLLPEVARA
jgi:hypothetical protein